MLACGTIRRRSRIAADDLDPLQRAEHRRLMQGEGTDLEAAVSRTLVFIITDIRVADIILRGEPTPQLPAHQLLPGQ